MKKPTIELGITLVETANKITDRTINLIKAQEALEILNYLLDGYSTNADYVFASNALYPKIKAQRKLLTKFLAIPKIKKGK